MKRLPSLVCKISAVALVLAGTLVNALGNGSPTNKALNVGDAVFRHVDDWRQDNTRGQIPRSALQGLDSGIGHRVVSAQRGGNIFLVLPVLPPGGAPSAGQRTTKEFGAGDLIGTAFRSGLCR